MTNNERVHELKPGDCFILSQNYWKEIINNADFHFLKIFKMVKWYKPSTWFKNYAIIEYYPKNIK